MTTPYFASHRHILMDAGRGFAILGILWLNIFIFALPLDAMAIPGIWGDTVWGGIDLNVEVWRFVGIAIDGVMRGMISILFGATALILLVRAEKAGGGLSALDPWYRRQIALIGMGVVHAYLLLWPYDILYLYGLFGLFLFPLRNWSVRSLMALTAILLVISALQGANEVSAPMNQRLEMRDSLTKEQLNTGRESDAFIEQQDKDGIDQETTQAILPESSDPAAASSGNQDVEGQDYSSHPEFQAMIQRIDTEIFERQQGYLANLVSLAPETLEEQTTEVVLHHITDVFSFMLIGMILLQKGFLTSGFPARFYRNTALICLPAATALGWFSGYRFEDGSTLAWWSDTLLVYVYDVRRLGFAIGFFALLAWLLHTKRLVWLTDALIACGRLALSLYILQTVICIFLFYGFGLALFGQLEHIEIAAVALVMTVFQLVLAPLWLRYLGQGPLERLLRWFTQRGVVREAVSSS